MKRLFIGIFALAIAGAAIAADTIIVPPNTGDAYFKDVNSNLLPLKISYTTDGAGHLQILTGGATADDDIIVPANSGKMYLNSADGNLYPAEVLYTTDGNGNVLPITTGGGGGTVFSVGLTLPAIFTVTSGPRIAEPAPTRKCRPALVSIAAGNGDGRAAEDFNLPRHVEESTPASGLWQARRP